MAGYQFRTIPPGVNAPLEFLTGVTDLAGISPLLAMSKTNPILRDGYLKNQVPLYLESPIKNGRRKLNFLLFKRDFSDILEHNIV